jgi:parallel beta-helix repeat protein
MARPSFTGPRTGARVPRKAVRSRTRAPGVPWRVALALAGAAVALVGLPASARAVPTTLYVNGSNPACTDSGAGTQAQPYCTITKSAKVALAGQTVLVAPGTYTENPAVWHSGTAGSPIVFAANPPGSVTITGGNRSFYISKLSYVTVTGFTTTNTSSAGLYVLNSNNIVLDGNHVTNAGQQQSGLTSRGIYLSGVTDSVVSNNEVDHNSDSGIYLTGGTTRVTVSGNDCHDNARGYQRAATGIDVRSPGNTIVGNWTHDNEDSGIQFYTGGDDNLAVNNVSFHNKGTSPILGSIGDHGIDDLGVSGMRIIGNSVYDNVTAGINAEGGSIGAYLANNISVDNGVKSPRTTSNIRIDPQSTNGTTIDYDQVYLSAGSGTQVIFGTQFFTSMSALFAATGQEGHGLQGNPQWIDPAVGRDFHLGASSPAIDSANSGANGALDHDYAGSPRVDDTAVTDTGAGPRTYDDRGAFEFQAGS